MGRQKTKFIINTPKSWDEVTLKMYAEIHRAYVEDKNPNSTKILSILSNIDEEEINKMPSTVVMKVFEHLKFLKEKIDDTPSNELEINGEKFKINTEDELIFKEYVDFQTVIQDDKYSFPQQLAILCRKENEEYNDDFITTKLKERIELFENISVTKILPLISFFLSSKKILSITMKRLSEEMIKQGNHILDNYQNFLNSGDGKKSSMKSQMKKLSTLRKQLNSL